MLQALLSTVKLPVGGGSTGAEQVPELLPPHDPEQVQFQLFPTGTAAELLPEAHIWAAAKSVVS
jgi:hypothetical protein